MWYFFQEGQSTTRFLSPSFSIAISDPSNIVRANLVGETASIHGEFHRHRASSVHPRSFQEAKILSLCLKPVPVARIINPRGK